MSLPELPRRALRRVMAAALTLGLGACLRPLYGPTVSGQPLADVLAAVQVEPVTVAAGQERLSHYVRSELVYDLNGSGQLQPKRYKLTVVAGGGATTPVTDSITGRADAVTINGTATYVLSNLDGGKIVASGTAVGSASYDRNPQRFATVRAARDAEIRLSKLLAEQIKVRLASALSTGNSPVGVSAGLPNASVGSNVELFPNRDKRF
jgi:LPS-assembly lipoprotein